ncbi:hypothetical protein E4H04_10980 [Candidatus Bathyarchaeota archaeon]|nr:MAG: hypothetical protein E4H04_10980 [Candidatus Bathyarchaeota archaeon]
MLEPEIMRHRITRIIAATRFPFVDQDTWPSGQQTIVNDEIKRYAISTDLGVLYPNIVIANPDGTIREIGVVESREDISEDSVPRWKALSKVAPIGREFKKLFLYVPDGTEEKTKKLIEVYGINYDGIRSYSVTNQTLKIIPYVTRNDEYDHTIT